MNVELEREVNELRHDELHIEMLVALYCTASGLHTGAPKLPWGVNCGWERSLIRTVKAYLQPYYQRSYIFKTLSLYFFDGVAAKVLQYHPLVPVALMGVPCHWPFSVAV